MQSKNPCSHSVARSLSFFLNRSGALSRLFQGFLVIRLPTSCLSQRFFSASSQFVDPQHFQQKYRQTYVKSMVTAVWFVLLGYLPWPPKPAVDLQTRGWATTLRRFPHHGVHHKGSLLLLENTVLFHTFLSLVASSPFQWVSFGGSPLLRSSHPSAMMLPLFLVKSRQPFLLPAAFMCPRAGFTPGFPLRRPLYCCQTILAVYAVGDSLSLWNELFYCCQLVREISLKAEPESGPGSDQFKVEASHHQAK